MDTPEPKPQEPVPGNIPPPPMMVMPAVTTRPASVTVIAIFFFLAAATELSSIMVLGKLPSILAVAAIMDSVVFFVVKLAVGIGLLRMQPWARMGAIYAMIARFVLGNLLTALELFSPLATGILTAPGVPPALIIAMSAVNSLFSIVIYAVVIFLLTRPDVKEAFGQGR
ncbi:MAG: hypothetical protein ACYC7E_07030 [Armatimonadota bacterium]